MLEPRTSRFSTILRQHRILSVIICLPLTSINLAAADTTMAADLNKQRELLAIRLRRGRQPSTSAYNLANDTVLFLRKVVAQSKYSGINELLHVVKMEGRHLSSAAPHEYVVHNMVLRVMKLIREEHARLLKGMEEEEEMDLAADTTLSTLWHSLAGDTSDSDGGGSTTDTTKVEVVEDDDRATGRTVDMKLLRKSIVTTLSEFVQEIEGARYDLDSSAMTLTVRAGIAAEAPLHVAPRETVITLGYSNTVVQFCREAATQKRFRLVVGQHSPENSGERMASTLRESYGEDKVTPRFDGLTVTPDAKLYSAMAHAHKVVLGAHAVLPDGGFIAVAGTYALCLAAKKYAVPVIVCAAFYKLTPCFLTAQDETDFNPMRSAMDIVGYNDACFMDKVDVYNSTFDYVPPELVTLYLMQAPGSAPSYVYRMVGDYYNAEDVTLAA